MRDRIGYADGRILQSKLQSEELEITAVSWVACEGKETDGEGGEIGDEDCEAWETGGDAG